MEVTALIVAALAAYRITRLLHWDDGPWEVFARLRGLISPRPQLAALFGCAWCLGLWVGVVVVIVTIFLPLWVLLPFALSGFVGAMYELGVWHGAK